MPIIGAHLHDGDPLALATSIGANAVQFFLGDPQDWKAPAFPGGREPAQVRSDFEAARVAAYVHAPYVINVASPNNRIRIPSRKILEQQLNAAASIGAAGLIVHGGHVTTGTNPADGYGSWRKAIERVGRPLPMLIENTAGGDGAMARSLDNLARLWDAVGDANGGEVGSSRDRHANLESGTIDPALLVAVVQAAGAPVICETPDAPADVRWLRARL